MPVPLGWPVRSLRLRLAVALGFASAATLIALGAQSVHPASVPLNLLNDLAYDSLYQVSGEYPNPDSAVVIIAVDESSLRAMEQSRHFGWHWPREFWGLLAQYLQRCGARAVVFDMLFSESSLYNAELGDDEKFASLIREIHIPVIFATDVKPDGTHSFAPPVDKPLLANTRLEEGAMLRRYWSVSRDMPSLALRAARALRADLSAPSAPFYLRYYGPHRRADGSTTYTYISAAAAIAPADAKTLVDPQTFRDKIVLIGQINAGGFDVKSSPVSAQYPAVEYNATAIDNLLQGLSIRPLGPVEIAVVALIAAVLCALAIALPQRTGLKIVLASTPFVALPVFSLILFRRNVFIPPASLLLSMFLSTAATAAWIYAAQERQRRFILKALAQYVSPGVASELARDPSRLSLGGQRREMTVLFSDIRDFTPMSETIPIERLPQLLNRYLEEMSAIVLEHDGTVDKYIGDSIMCFWNAPLAQPDHALRACRAALAMRDRGREIAAELNHLGAPGEIFTRIGVNTGPMVVGNMGSTRKFSYTVIGDSVNHASRLENANRFYGSQIIVSDSTALLVGGQFVLRRLDLLQVKGRGAPAAVFELLSDDVRDERASRLKNQYETAWDCYARRDWGRAEPMLLENQRKFGDDPASAALLDRVRAYRENPPPPDWSGAFAPGEK
ncbi:MAG: CHASE2 domain-containing protein [Tepidisphaeraceae bacterium]